MLQGTEAMLDRLASRLQSDFSMATASLEVLRLEPSLRNEIGSVLTPPKQSTLNLLYALVICRGRVVTLLRPKKHSVHPSDLHILLNTIYSSPSLVAPGSESWIPICLPKFNPNGFLHALVSFIHKDLGMVMVTADKEAFFPMKEWKDAVNQRITNSSILRPLLQAAEHESYSLGASVSSHPSIDEIIDVFICRRCCCSWCATLSLQVAHQCPNHFSWLARHL